MNSEEEEYEEYNNYEEVDTSAWDLEEEEDEAPQFEEIDPVYYQNLDEEDFEEEDDEEEDVFSQDFIDRLIDKIMLFMEGLVGHPLHDYQQPLAKRIIEAVLIGKGDEITALASRQSGKSETIANTVATLMVLLPKLSVLYPELFPHCQ